MFAQGIGKMFFHIRKTHFGQCVKIFFFGFTQEFEPFFRDDIILFFDRPADPFDF